MKHRPIAYFSALFWVVALAGTAGWACPVCHSATATELREGLSITMRDHTIWMAVILPFFIIAGVLKLMNRASDPSEVGEERKKK